MKPIVVKIGGSTLGKHDTTIEDLVELQKQNIPVVVVHGGGKTSTKWLDKSNIPTEFINGLRVTDFKTLKVVTAVLSGLVNKELVSKLNSLGGKAVGLSGVDGNIIQARNIHPELRYTGEELFIDVSLLSLLLNNGYLPVVAPISKGMYEESNGETDLINVNADTAAAEIAADIEAEKLIFLTDVSGLHNVSGDVIKQVSPRDAREMIESGIISGGMTAKIEACLHVLDKIRMIRIIDGRVGHALREEMRGIESGTTIA
jgi:acetylglutamate kinase